MIIAAILATLLGLGGLYYLVQLSGSTPTLLETLLTPFTLTVTHTFQILGALAPLLVAIIPIYLALNRKTTRGENQNKIIAFSAIYGLALYGLAVFTGLDTQLTQSMRSSMYLGSTISLAYTTLGPIASWITGTLTALLLWGTGLTLAIIEGALDLIIGIGDTATQGKHTVRRLQQNVLDRLGGSTHE